MGWLTAAACLVLAAWAAIAEAHTASAAAQEWLVPLVGLLLATASWAMRGPLAASGAGACRGGSLVVRVVVAMVAAGAPGGPAARAAGGGVRESCGAGTALLRRCRCRSPWAMLEQPAVGVRVRVRRCAGAVAAHARVVRCRCRGGPGGRNPGLCVAGVPGRPRGVRPVRLVAGLRGRLGGAAFALVLGSRAEVTRRRATVDRLVAGAGAAGSTGLSQRARGGRCEPPGCRSSVRRSNPTRARTCRSRWATAWWPSYVTPAVVALEPAARDDVAAAVRLVLLGEERRAALDEQAVALTAAQRRMVTAQDQQRALTAAKLRSAVVAPSTRGRVRSGR